MDLFFYNQLKIDLISKFYPFKREKILANKNKINFESYHFMDNKNIKWHVELITELKNSIDWNVFYKIKSKIVIDDRFIAAFGNFIDIKSLFYVKFV
ncbi:hypothetical protein [Sphingobacterium sp.]|uniref:hypothetical protein n=1 Tax=Sphingobacterium sp. TaxID=341027 RepID=UPI0028A83C68|nr:hypothetical protein [Sphingobacterium sp.]